MLRYLLPVMLWCPRCHLRLNFRVGPGPGSPVQVGTMCTGNRRARIPHKAQAHGQPAPSSQPARQAGQQNRPRPPDGSNPRHPAIRHPAIRGLAPHSHRSATAPGEQG